MEAVVLHRVGFLEYFCPKQGQDFKPSAAPIYPNMSKVALPGSALRVCQPILESSSAQFICPFGHKLNFALPILVNHSYVKRSSLSIIQENANLAI